MSDEKHQSNGPDPAGAKPSLAGSDAGYSNDASTDKVWRYLASIHRQSLQAMKELERL